MKIVWEPKDGPRREWVFQPAELASNEAELIEDAMDLPYQVCVGKFLAGSIRARRALLWVFLRREAPKLQFDQVRFTVGEVYEDFDDEEITRMRERLEEYGDTEPDNPIDEAAVDQLRKILAARDGAAEEVAADLAGVEPGKGTAVPDAAVSST